MSIGERDMELNLAKQIEYFICRYSLFKEKQMHINDFIDPKTKEEVFDSFIQRLKNDIKMEFPLEDKEFIMYYIETISGKQHLFKFAKKIERTLNQPRFSDIEPTQVEDYPWCSLIVDVERQVFLISKNSQITSNITTLKNYIAKTISYAMKEHQVSLQLELMTNKNSFWETIAQNAGEIQFIELSLVSPNFLGQSYSTTKMLQEFRGELNNDSVVLRFINERGKLNVSSKSHFLRDILEYIANGCGSWKVKIESQRKAMTSEEQAVVYPLDVDIFTMTASQKEDIRIAFSHLDALETDNHKKGDMKNEDHG